MKIKDLIAILKRYGPESEIALREPATGRVLPIEVRANSPYSKHPAAWVITGEYHKADSNG